MTFHPSRLAAALRSPGRRLAPALRARLVPAWPGLPRRSVRLRLTALYGCLFLLSGAGLLAITNLLVHRSTATAFFIKKSNGPEHIQGVIGGFSARIGPPVHLVARLPAGQAGGQAGGQTKLRLEDTPNARLSHVVHVTADVPLRPATGAPVLAGGSGAAQSRALTGSPSQQPPSPEQLQAQADQLTALATRQQSVEHNHLLVISGIALGIMALISLVLGWLVSGRVLAPLRTMTAATRRISEHNLHERLALRGPDDELKDLADTIDGLLARLQEAFDAQRRFVANASHELRTPLAMMRTSLDVATAKPDPPPQLTVLEHKLREGLDQAERLLESFLALARAQHGALGEQRPVALAPIVRGAIDAHALAIAQRRIDLHQAIDTEGPLIGSHTLLRRMVENLIENAIRHNQPGGWMRVAIATHDEPEPGQGQGQGQGHGHGHEPGLLRLVVESSGAPLEERAVAQLAQPFRRLGAERTGSRDGVGLGLSIVAAIAAAHGGALHLRARPEGGLRACVELPRADDQPHGGARATQRSTEKPTSEGRA
ncbi:MAG: HAMP domain-containing histidine kinase [Solirubrobacterales bacterium]|nr:HAMP domain-containing histidine kinase [Solirubrobacterales bacterium]